ncbi:hypothetical protein BLNAU_1937 [Blattamonas nauphoetae]|uniref:Uncharacterized protein n=1 Tax=Blattamonas nauphoetae TaxID=2049346 RepID=A0ABQ9YH64_9EUKA|nr:hypothetical protein BLNAU_1937 [Blattamonas nauphoetae]
MHTYLVAITLRKLPSLTKYTSCRNSGEDFAAFLEGRSKLQNNPSFSTASTIIIPIGIYHAQEVPIHSRNVDLSGLSSTISHRYSIHNLAGENRSQHPDNNEYRSSKGLSVMFDLFNSTCRLDTLQLFANTPDTAVSLIRSSTLVVSRSEITSCPDTSPFVIGDSGMESSVSVSLISCSHRSSSESSSLLPLVSMPRSSWCSSQMRSNEEGHADAFGVGSLSIVGSGLSMNSKHLVIGTGPLFDFGTCFGNGLTGVVGCSVSLSSSSLTNTTSTRLPSTIPCSCSFVTQRLIGVSVSESTNHLCGTSGMSWDWSGSSLLSNCSFTSCVTNAAPGKISEPTKNSSMTYQSYSSKTTRISLKQGFSDETVHNPIWITSCKFNSLTAPSNDGGAAVNIEYYRAHVFIKASSFTQCHAYGWSHTHGGAVFVCQTNTAANVYSATVFNCQFTNNTAGYGGHLSLQDCNPVTIAQCTFTKSQSRVDPTSSKWSSLRVSLSGECRFDNCTVSKNTGSNTGGIEYMQYLSAGKIVLTDVLFDENVCTSPTASEHVIDFLFYKDIGIDNREFYDCFSTSTPIKCASRYAEKIYPDLIGPSIISVGQTIQENANGDGFDVVLSFEGVFTGTSRKYDVTLEDADGSEFVAKSVSFSRTAGTATFALSNPSVSSLSSSTTYSIVEVKKSASQSTSNEFIEGGVTEPDWTWWHHTPKSRADNMIAMSFTTPAGPTLTNIKADLNPSNLNEVEVNVTVSPISTGSFTLVVFDSSDPLKTEITIGPFSFTLSSTPKTSSHTVLIHPSDELSYGMTYTVKTLSSSTLIVYHTGQTLTMPDAPPRLSEATPTLTGLNKTFVTLSLSGAALPGATDFGIVVKEMEGNAIKNGASEITLTGTIGGTIGSTETTCTTSVEIYTKTGTLEYSKKYKIISLSIVGLSCIVDPTAIFEVPDSPGRVEKMMTPKLNGVKTEVSVVVTGAGELTAKFQAGTLESGTELEFEKSYEIESVSGQSEVFLNAGVGFTVPAAGIVASTSTELNAATNEHFKVIVSGKNFVAGTKWNLKLTDRSEEILVTMSSATTGESSWVKGGGLTEIQFGSSYPVASMTEVSNSSEHVVCDGVCLQTPTGPTLNSIKADLNLSNLNEAIINITASRISTGSYTLVVFDSSDPLKTEITIGPFSFTSLSTETTKTLTVLIHPSGLLSYGKTYTVKTLSSPTLIVKHSSPTFSIPPKPTVSVLHISSAGSDENEGTENDPLLTLHTALGKCKTELIEVWVMEIADWCRIGKQTKLGHEQEGLSVIVRGGEGRKIECALTDSVQTSEQRDTKEQGMVSVSKNTLSFVDVMFVVTSSSVRIGSVFVVGEGGVVWMERCKVSSSNTIKHRFMTIWKDGEMKGEELQMSSMRFGGKGSVVCV